MKKNELMLVTKKFFFSAGHKLACEKFSSKKNREIFGDCYSYHGHNYELEVSVYGNVDPITGMVINFSDIKKIIEKLVLKRFDHKNLNDLDEFKNKVPTAENILLVIRDIMASSNIRVKRLKLWETPNCHVELLIE